jgi:putative methionine-R-sulfoxide reductase with GAF domain
MTATLTSLLPGNEIARLETLRQYDILHSLQEAVFMEFVGLTARIFNLPISLVALVDADEVAYAANEGLPGLRSQPRAETLCALAVREHKTVIITDVAEKEGLTTEAATAAEAKGLRFYAGAPLSMPDQRSIGTLCVIDRRPRTFSADEQQLLEHIAGLVASTIAVRHYCRSRAGKGEKHWQLVQRHLVDEIRELVALVRYLSARFGTQVPVSSAVLEPVQRRLYDLGRLLGEYLSYQ